MMQILRNLYKKIADKPELWMPGMSVKAQHCPNCTHVMLHEGGGRYFCLTCHSHLVR